MEQEIQKCYNWVRDNITSSVTIWQLECCQILLELFRKKYPQETTSELEMLIYDQKNYINYV